MAAIVPTVEHILGKKEFIYSASMIDSVIGDQGTLDIKRLKGGTIEVAGLSITSVRSVFVKGTADVSVGATLRTIPVVASPSASADVLLFGNQGASVSVAVNGVSVLGSLSGNTSVFLKIPDGLAQIGLRVEGATTAGVTAKFFGKSY